MALTGGKILARPDRASLGVITAVGPVKKSEKGVFHVIKIEIEGQQGGLDQDFYYIFLPMFFGRNFDPVRDLAENEDFEPIVSTEEKVFDGEKLYGFYLRYVSDSTKGKSSVLQALLGGADKLAEFGAQIDELEADPDPAGVEQLLRENLVGNEVGYVSRQRKEEDGSLRDGFEISYFFEATEEGIEAIVKSANNPRRRKPLVITWDESAA